MIRNVLYIISLLIVLNILFTFIAWERAINLLKENQIDKPHNAAIVFFHGFHGKTNINKETKLRLNKAIQLYNDSLVQYIICTGGMRKNLKCSGSNRMKQYLREKHIPSQNILIDSLSYDTYSNWNHVQKILRQKEWKSAVLVSSPPHFLRISKITGQSDIDLAYSTFPEIYKELSLVKQWKDIQYEFIGIIARFFLPTDIYNKLLFQYRVS